VGNEGQIVRYRQLGKDGGFEVVPVAKELLCLNMLGSGTTLALCTCAVLLHTDGGTNQKDTQAGDPIRDRQRPCGQRVT
jgi:hypothetical protein